MKIAPVVLPVLLALSLSQRSLFSQATSRSNSQNLTLKGKISDTSGLRRKSRGFNERRSNITLRKQDLSRSKSLLEWYPVEGHLQFEKLGRIVPTAKMGHIVINIDMWEVQKELWQRLDKMKEHWSITWKSRTKKAMEWMSTIMQTLGMRQFKHRTNRGVLGALGTLIGAFNFWQSQNHADLEQKIRMALKETATRVDALQSWQDKQASLFQQMMDGLHKSNNHSASQDAQIAWMEFEHKMQALRLVVNGLVHGKLHPAIQDLIGWSSALQRFSDHHRQAALRSPLQNPLEALGCPVSFWTREHLLRLVVHIPLKQQGHREAELFAHRRLPLRSRRGLTTWVQSTGALLATDGERFLEMQQADLDRCVQLRDIRFCSHLAVAFVNSKGSCLGALWAEDWLAVRTNCVLINQPATTGAWQTGSGMVAVLFPEAATLLVQCPDGRASHESVQGYGLILVPEGCRAVSEEVEILSPGEDQEKKIVSIEVNASSWEVLAPEILKLPDLTISRPKSMTALADKVNRILHKDPMFKWTTILALCIAAVAALVCVALLAFVYCKFKIAQKKVPLPISNDPIYDVPPS